MNCISKYQELYFKEPEAVAFCPYRIASLGAHIDYQNGAINGLSIDKGIHIAYGRKESGICEIWSLQFPKRAQFHVNEIPEEKQNDWADHCRAAAKMLGEKYKLRYGISAVIEGSLPIGGLSSSAAVIIAFLSALSAVNGIKLEQWETIMMAKAAAYDLMAFAGLPYGKFSEAVFEEYKDRLPEPFRRRASHFLPSIRGLRWELNFGNPETLKAMDSLCLSPEEAVSTTMSVAVLN